MKQTASPEWACQQAVELLGLARQAEEVDHSACAKYLELIVKVLLPKTSRSDEGQDAVRAAREAAEAELAAKREKK